MQHLLAKPTSFFTLLCFVLINFSKINNMMTGGLGEEKPANGEIQEIVDNLKDDVKAICNQEFERFIAVSYKSQVVAGVNYFIKVDVGDEHYIHIRVYKPLPHTGQEEELAACQDGKSKDDDITYF
ncbi:cystatin-A-like [Ylistrum balloti]|uniref:cystatin-A-like n=1 Tax=Ylistrum balloti TaxID=509963 RepID=UPI002905DC5C|nr:cystatin-A-like [Ylistrum balloti]